MAARSKTDLPRRQQYVGRLPSGEFTRSRKTYLAAWDRIRKPLQTEFGLQTIGFDPGLLMRDADSGSVVDLPVCVAVNLLKRIGISVG